MANGTFNVVKGKYRYYCELPAANDGLVVVLLKSAGLEVDDNLNNYDTLSAILGATTDEADFTNYARKVLTASPTITESDIANSVDVDIPDQVWVNAGGASNNSLGKLLVCYDGDVAAGTDANIIPLSYHDFVETTDGSNLAANIDTAGFVGTRAG